MPNCVLVTMSGHVHTPSRPSPHVSLAVTVASPHAVTAARAHRHLAYACAVNRDMSAAEECAEDADDVKTIAATSSSPKLQVN